MIKNTIIGIIIGGIITIVVGYIFFDLGNKKREPVYTINNDPSVIFDKSNSSPKIKLLVDDSLYIDNNVYVSTISIWNKGKLPINKEDIRNDLFIQLSDSSSKLLDFKILKEKSPILNNFKINQIKNTFKITWDFFDPNNGFMIQIIYTGTDKTQIQVVGSVLGSKVKQVTTKTKETKIDRIGSFALIGMFLIALASFWYSYYTKGRPKERQGIIWFITVMIIIMVLSILIKDRELIFAIGIPF